jgi:hypothetical protein
MTDFCDLPKAIVRTTSSDEVTETAPDRQSILWDWQALILYAAAENLTFTDVFNLTINRIMVDDGTGEIMIDESGNVVTTGG